MALSDTAIRNAKLGVKSARLFDGGGAYVELAPGGGKGWRLKYRRGGKEMRLSLGTCPDVSLTALGARRASARQKLAEGEDPSALRKAALSKPALSLLAPMRQLSDDGALVLPLPFYLGKPLSDGTLNSALAGLGYKGMATARGCWNLFSTCANETGWNSYQIEKQLAPEERDEVRGTYNRAQWMTERAKLMQWWADRLDAWCEEAQVLSKGSSE